MDPSTTTTGRLARSRRRPPAAVRRPALYLGVATAGAVLVGAVVGPEPAAQAEAAPSETVSVARELGLTAASGPVDVTTELQPLQDLAASRSTREAAEVAAQQAQAAADQAVLDRQRAEADAAAKAAAEADAAARAAAEAAARQVAPAQAGAAAPAAAAPRAAAAAPGRVARVTNSSGPVAPRVQAAADRVVSDVPGAGSITLGGTRPSATDPGGHPSGNALDYMVLTDAGLGDAIAAYHIAHWDELGVEYVIWQQRMLSSPNGSWKPMADRGGTTANHYDHVHVNYRG
jgi:hypothetical protein